MDLYLPAEEATQINVVFPDGTRQTVDAIDLDLLEYKLGDIPEDSDFYSELARLYSQKLGSRVSKGAALVIYQRKREIMQELKKNSFPSPEPSASTEPESSEDQTNESSDSSNSQNQSSKRKKS